MTFSALDNARTSSPLSERAARALRFGLGDAPALGLAVSGGSDSTALLILASEAAAQTGVRLKAATVDHGLRAEAAEEARKVGEICRGLGVEHATLSWRREGAGRVNQEAARRARHALLANWAHAEGLGVLALGHTRDDRLETFLMRVRQGSGWHGLAGLLPTGFSPIWPEGRGLRLIRPLLAFGREDLRAELSARGLAWIEDPSNEAVTFERVRMRRLLQRMNPKAKTQALSVMDALMEIRASVAAQAQGLLGEVRMEPETAYLPVLAREGPSAEAWLRLIEALVMAAGGGVGPPPRDGLNRLIDRIAAREPDLARGVTLAGAAIRLSGGDLAFRQAPGRALDAPRPAPDWVRARQLLTMPDLRMIAV